MVFVGQALKQMVAKLGGAQLAIGSLTLAFAGLGASVYLLSQITANWGNMDGLERFISILGALTVVALSAALAIGTFHSAWSLGLVAANIAAGIAVVTVAIGKAQKRAENLESLNGSKVNFRASGGFNPIGNLMVTNEQGAPEWVGKAGNQSAVVNDTQMNDIMYEAVREGIIDGLSSSDKGGVNVTLDFKGTDTNAFARAIVNPMVYEMKRQGYKIQKA